MKKQKVLKEISLSFIWRLRLKLRAEGNKLRVEGNKLWAEGDKLRAEGDKLRAEGNKLRAEGDKLRAEGNKLWAEAIIEAKGNIKIEWIWRDKKQASACKLETGEVFEP
jgi:cell division protein FtsB